MKKVAEKNEVDSEKVAEKNENTFACYIGGTTKFTFKKSLINDPVPSDKLIVDPEGIEANLNNESDASDKLLEDKIDKIVNGESISEHGIKEVTKLKMLKNGEVSNAKSDKIEAKNVNLNVDTSENLGSDSKLNSNLSPHSNEHGQCQLAPIKLDLGPNEIL